MSLIECSHLGLSVHNCGHYEDVSIICGNGACLSFLCLNFIRSTRRTSKAFYFASVHFLPNLLYLWYALRQMYTKRVILDWTWINISDMLPIPWVMFRPTRGRGEIRNFASTFDSSFIWVARVSKRNSITEIQNNFGNADNWPTFLYKYDVVRLHFSENYWAAWSQEAMQH